MLKYGCLVTPIDRQYVGYIPSLDIHGDCRCGTEGGVKSNLHVKLRRYLNHQVKMGEKIALPLSGEDKTYPHFLYLTPLTSWRVLLWNLLIDKLIYEQEWNPDYHLTGDELDNLFDFEKPAQYTQFLIIAATLGVELNVSLTPL